MRIYLLLTVAFLLSCCQDESCRLNFDTNLDVLNRIECSYETECSIVVYIDGNCPECLHYIREINSIIENKIKSIYIVSADDEITLRYFLEKNIIHANILYDNKGGFSEKNNIQNSNQAFIIDKNNNIMKRSRCLNNEVIAKFTRYATEKCKC